MFNQFKNYVAEINDLLCTINILNWDANSNMPAGGAKTRGLQIATIAKIVQERLSSEKFGELIGQAEEVVSAEPDTSYRKRMVIEAKRAYEISKRVPAAIVGQLAETRSIAEQVWVEAKANNDFAQFAPYLKQSIKLNRELIEAVGYPADGHPYDVMLDRYEPGMTAARLKVIFAELRATLKPLLDNIVNSPIKMPVEILTGDYPIDQQKAFCFDIAQTLGYDMHRGQFADSPHPFEISFTREDVRITNRYHTDSLGGGLFGMIHEVGHALYEQGISPELTRTALATDFLSQYAVGGVTFGMHEAQSRLWENQIGRSFPFWQLHYSKLQSHFPNQLGNVDVETFYRAINHVEPSLIRTEADEVTYNFHIMLRVDMEMGLLDGSIDVDDLPNLWREKMEATLGIVPPTDTLGVLQDIHWSFGQMGTFPAYTLGNIMSAQLLQAAKKQITSLDTDLKEGNYQTLLDWLTENIYQHGRAYSPDELLQNTAGETLNTQPYLNYLTEKYSRLYQISNRQ